MAKLGDPTDFSYRVNKVTKVVDGDLVKILAWYDNEWGFANQMIRQVIDNETY